MVADFNARQIGDIEAMLAWLGHQRLELAALWPDRPAPECLHASERNAICGWFSARDGKADLYISSNEVSPKHFGSNCRAKSTDIPTPRVLLLDVDPGRDDLPPGRALLAAIAMLPRVRELDPHPLLMNSGRGAQVLLHVEHGRRLEIWNRLRRESSKLLGGYECHLDPTHDVARLCRMPGTTNLEVGRMASIVPIPQELPRHLAETLSGTRRDLNDHSRSGFEMAAADALAKFGFSQTEIEELLLAYPHGRGQAEHPSSRQGTARKAVTQRQRKIHAPESIPAAAAATPTSSQATPSLSISLTPEQARGMLADLLFQVGGFLSSYLAISTAQTHVLANWVFHTHAIDAADRTPYLHVKSPEKRCGKSLLLDLLKLLVRNAWRTSNASPAAIPRKISLRRPTALFDEADTYIRAEDERGETLRGVLDAGFERGGAYSRCVGQGTALKVEDFDVFCPKAIAGLRDLPDTIADRSIPIKMKRALPGEIRKRFYRREVEPTAAALRVRAESCAAALLLALQEARPDRVPELNDRQNDIVEPLLAIADLAGDGWPEHLRGFLRELFQTEEEGDESLGVRLLADLREIFTERGVEHLATADLVQALCERPESPWADWRGKGITGHSLARMLRGFGIKPGRWRDGSQIVRGYEAESFRDPWARYLAVPSSSQEGGQTSQTSQTAESTS